MFIYSEFVSSEGNRQNTSGLIVDDVPALECLHGIKYGTGIQHWLSKLGQSQMRIVKYGREFCGTSTHE
jgi:hypothetical protein